MDEKKELTRREFLGWAAAAAALALLPGCEPAYQAEVAPGRARRTVSGNAYASAYGSAPSYVAASYDPNQPYVVMPSQPAPIVGSPGYVIVEPSPVIQAAYTPPAQTYSPPPVSYQQPAPVYQQAPAAASSAGKLKAVSRQSWAVVPPNPNKMRPMNGVTRLTIHHEGSAKPNNDTNPAQVAATLRLIQSQHHKRMGAGDIGYHFIIDRTGTIWQGRDWRYQGAHTSGANSNNIGVMLLGNFELQQPTGQQLSSLRSLVVSLARMYNLDLRKDIFGHSDFCNTQCPGKHMKQHVRAFKSLR